jgi:tetratricopeptide (TPR) repeat protein
VFLGRAFAGAGRRDEALAIAKKLAESKQYLAPSEIATLYAALGDHEKAFAALEKAFAERDLQLRFMRVDPGYDPIRNDPRFADLLRRLGLG